MKLPFEIAQNKRFDAVGFGLNAVDHLIVVPHYPAYDTKTRLLEHKQSAGGQTATAIVALQRLGMKTAYAGRFGSDAEGEFGLRTLIDEGVDVEFAEVVPNSRNQLAFILIDAHNGERTIIWDRDDRLAYQPHEVPMPVASSGKVLHLDAHDPPACARMAQAARQAGTIVTADIDNVYEGLPELLPFIDVLITSRQFPDRLMGIKDETEALLELKARYGCAVVGLTKGVEGVVVHTAGEIFHSRAYEVPGGCKDTTGAGDAFHAGFIYGMLKGDELETCLKLANATAALKCRELGARTALPNPDELESFLA
jgi:sugar/nucleoside kinase (ribokinase family)